MSETPSRTPTTPRSRSRSRTPRRTPRGTPSNRRRSMIQTAAVLLTTPRRSRKRSMTPQNTLRILSRALVRENDVEVQDVKDRQDVKDIQQDDQEVIQDQSLDPFLGDAFIMEEPDERTMVPIPQDHDQDEPMPDVSREHHTPLTPTPEENTPQVNTPHVNTPERTLENLFTPEKTHTPRDHTSQSSRQGLTPEQQDQHTPVYTPQQQEYTPQRSITPTSDELRTPTRPLYSDIAIPQGIAPENVFLDVNDEEVDITTNTASAVSPKHEKQVDVVDDVVDDEPTERIPAPTPNFKTHNAKAIRQLTKEISSKPLNSDSLSVLTETLDMYIDQLSTDLESYANHSNAKSMINIKTMYLLYKRQRLIHSVEEFLELTDRNLPLEDIMEIRRNVHKITN